jgi:peptidoglycan/LPS O-acetylase OafA/YrhL
MECSRNGPSPKPAVLHARQDGELSFGPQAVRADIQFLRGIAVLAVVLYHARLIPLKGGFLGVDMFFVISGYLITGNILKSLGEGRFSFSEFYLRRAFRLLPAAYCTLALCTLAAIWVLPSDQWADYTKQVAGAISFTANMVLPMQSGYFETAAELKPLLHIWSLSLEEQYYLILPAILVLTRPRWHAALLGLLTISSLVLCAVMVQAAFVYWRLPMIDSRQAAFYLLPTRAWELLLGSLLAWATLHQHVPILPPWTRRAAAGLLVLLFVAPTDPVHPRVDAMLVVFATTIALAGSAEWLPKGALTQAVARVGDWSYSFYLIHWPLLVFAKLAFLDIVPWPARLAVVIASLGLAALQYRYVEQRYRHSWRQHRVKSFGTIAALSVVVLSMPIGAVALRGISEWRDLSYLAEPNHGLSRQCAEGGALASATSCSTQSNPRVALWGDSYAMHLVPGMLQMPEIAKGGLLQVTKAACAPVMGVAALDGNYDEKWAARCLAFNEHAMAMLESNPSITHVVLSSPLQGYLNYGELKLYMDGQALTARREQVVSAMVQTVRRLQAAGKRPILIAPPPTMGFDIGQCHSRQLAGLLVLGRKSCDFDLADRNAYQRGIPEGLAEVARRTGVPLLDFDWVICPNGLCITDAGGAVLYKDHGHLSVRGSRYLVPRLGLGQHLVEK